MEEIARSMPRRWAPWLTCGDALAIGAIVAAHASYVVRLANCFSKPGHRTIIA